MDRLLAGTRRLAASCALAVALLVPLAGQAAAQDAVAAGRTVFSANCAVCHMATANGHTMIGPNLYGVVGRRAASVPGFVYSPAMQHSGITWTTAQIEAFTQAPSHVVPGTRMTFAGLHTPQQAAAVAAYLGSLTAPAAH